MHDGILIGVGTAVNDNPQLNGAYPIVIPACYTTID
jgi:riboflavin biosynthesis pyrimidine reductase